MFFISVFFLPIFASIPFWETGSALVIVGSLMIRKWVLFLQAMIYDVSICSPRDCWNKLGLSWQRRSRLPHHSPYLQVCLVCLTAHSFNSPCLLNGIAYGVLAGVITSCSIPSSFARFQEEGSLLIIMGIQKDGSSHLVAFYHSESASCWGARRRKIIVWISRQDRPRARELSLTVWLEKLAPSWGCRNPYAQVGEWYLGSSTTNVVKLTINALSDNRLYVLVGELLTKFISNVLTRNGKSALWSSKIIHCRRRAGRISTPIVW